MPFAESPGELHSDVCRAPAVVAHILGDPAVSPRPPALDTALARVVTACAATGEPAAGALPVSAAWMADTLLGAVAVADLT